MIQFGVPPDRKGEIVQAAARTQRANRVVILGPAAARFPHDLEAQEVDYPDIYTYRVFYPLMQAVDRHTLVVVNECLRTQNRYDLTYNCIRNICQQAGQVLVFQYLPIIATREDFCVLFDWDTGSRYKRLRFDELPLGEAQVSGVAVRPRVVVRQAEADSATRSRYERERERLFAGLGNKHPDTIPRNLYKVGAPVKRPLMAPGRVYLSTRRAFEDVATYGDPTVSKADILEFPWRHGELCDYVSRTGQSRFEVLTTDLPVDRLFLDRFLLWRGEVTHVQTALSL